MQKLILEFIEWYERVHTTYNCFTCNELTFYFREVNVKTSEERAALETMWSQLVGVTNKAGGYVPFQSQANIQAPDASYKEYLNLVMQLRKERLQQIKEELSC